MFRLLCESFRLFWGFILGFNNFGRVHLCLVPCLLGKGLNPVVSVSGAKSIKLEEMYCYDVGYSLHVGCSLHEAGLMMMTMVMMNMRQCIPVSDGQLLFYLTNSHNRERHTVSHQHPDHNGTVFSSPHSY